MNRRVFHIDQECYIIYVEDLSSKKERFLRIGNSTFLKEFGDNLTFVTLLSKVYPGDPFNELDIFRPNVDRKIIGLKDIANRFIYFLKQNNVNVNSLNIVYPEEGSSIFKEAKSEEDFLQKIEGDNKISKHSFASFYIDGNIRIFNKSEVIFDLKENLYRALSESKEIKQLSEFFLKFYKESYEKSGIIHSNKSLFIFSQNQFACITDSTSWVKDAIRVGIDPFKIELIYVTERTIPDSLCLKSILNKEKADSKIKLLHKEELRWEKLLSPDNIMSLNPYKKTINHKLGDINLNFKENKITISFNSFKLTLDDNDSFLSSGKIIQGEFSESSIKKDFELIIDSFKKDSLTLYSYNPVVFEKFIEDNNYISNFWSNFSEKIIGYNSLKILPDDSGYGKDYFPDLNNKEFHSKLFTETVRRLNCEGSMGIDDNLYNEYLKVINNFTGEEINKNKQIIEQSLGYGVNEDRICIRDILHNKELVYFDDKVNPFLNFQKEAEKNEWQEKQEEYRNKHKKNINESKMLTDINLRFADVINAKQFHIEERERLKRFMETVIIKEKQKENKVQAEKIKSEAQTQAEATRKIYPEEEKLQKFKESKTSYKKERQFNGKKVGKVLGIAAIIIGILLILFLASLFILPEKYKKGIITSIAKVDKNKNSIINKILSLNKDNKNIIDNMDNEENIASKDNKDNKNRENKYIKPDNNKTPSKSTNFKFFMTMLDLLNLTNLVAEKNGYHKIVYDFEKTYVKGKDPDWIYPGNNLTMPDSSKTTVVDGDVMWNLCEKFLINQINKNELEIQDVIDRRRTKELSFEDSKTELLKIKNESYSEMLRDFIDEILQLKDIEEIDKLLKNPN